jgi:hypothetical protein
MSNLLNRGRTIADYGPTLQRAPEDRLRNIYEVYESNASPLAKEALERIAELFESETRINGRAPQERLAVRQQEAVPLLRTVLTC